MCIRDSINAAQREQVAANARGEAEKILVVKKAEAESESKALQGQGIANQRKAIIEGLQVSIEQFQKVVDGASAKEVMQLVMVTQYFDTLKSCLLYTSFENAEEMEKVAQRVASLSLSVRQTENYVQGLIHPEKPAKKELKPAPPIDPNVRERCV